MSFVPKRLEASVFKSFFICFAEKKEMEKLASDVLRRFGDGISKSRSTKNLTRQKEFKSKSSLFISLVISVFGFAVGREFRTFDLKIMSTSNLIDF